MSLPAIWTAKSCKAVIDAFLQARSEMDATIFMVTHDSYAASFCDRVIVLKDGLKVHGELKELVPEERSWMNC